MSWIKSLIIVWPLVWWGAAALGGEVLLTENFERGLPADWRAGGATVIEEPGNPKNHVLALSFPGKSGSVSFGEERWKNYRLSGRFKVQEAKGEWFHVKFSVRTQGTASSYYVNARDTGAWLMFHAGQNFKQIVSLGEARVKPGQWYAVEVECAGPLLTGRLRDQATGAVVGEARTMDETLSNGACQLGIAMAPGGTGTFLFDDVRVEAVAETAAKAAQAVAIESRTARVEFDPNLGRFDIVDLRNQQRWPQVARGSTMPIVSDVKRGADGRRLEAKLETPMGALEMSLAVDDAAEVLMTLRPAGPGKRTAIGYPWPLLPPADKAEIVLPADEGTILPATGVDIPRAVGMYSYSQSGFLMPWFGVVEGERGLMALVETPDDLQIQVGTSKSAQGGKALLTPGISWMASQADLRYERRVRFCAFEQGGYVAMAKRYRKFLVDQHRFRTLAEKAKEIPEVQKLIGAIDIYDHAAKGDTTVLDWMIHNGIKRALYYGRDERAPNDKARAAGYVTGRYDIYTDIGTPELMAFWKKQPTPGDPRLSGYPDEAFVRQDGTLQPGFAYPVNAKGAVLAPGETLKTIPCVYRCSATKQAWLKKIVPAHAGEFGFTSRFLDVETASMLTECYSDKHGMTRTQDRTTRTALFDYLRSIGQIAASEGGADWAAMALHYQEGSLTLNHFASLKGVYVGTKPFDLPPEYIAAQFNMARRVPLHKLVYHDSVLMTWRWNHTPNRWVKGAEYWDEWDLIHVLYGGMPIFVINKQQVEEKGPRILQSYRNICGVLEKIGGSEMVAHQFLTPDRQAQETRFANGWAVVVNFDKSASYARPGGKTLGPKSFDTYRWK